MNGIKDKVVFLSGGTSGLGAEISRTFAKEGAKVVIFSPDEKGGLEIEKELNSISEGLYIKGDVRSMDDINAAMDTLLEKFGNLHFAINCAGVSGRPHEFTEVPGDMYDFVMDVNVKGTFQCMQAQIKIMEKNGFGKIVNVSSEAAFTAGNGKLPVYCVSKHALNGLTRSAAVTYAEKGININSLAPGTMMTPFLAENYPEEVVQNLRDVRPTKRLVEVKAVANMAVYMCSDYTNDMVGSAIVVDGGRIAQ